MVKLDKIYTKGGDSGQTGLSDGSRVSKASLRIAAIGAVDEANSAIGVARLQADGHFGVMLARIQNDLFDLGADLSAPQDGRKGESRLRIVPVQVERLEREIDAMNEQLLLCIGCIKKKIKKVLVIDLVLSYVVLNKY